MDTILLMMKAMPFTTGHEDIIRFASGLGERLVVSLDYHPDEPFIEKRIHAIGSFLATLDIKYSLQSREVIPQREEDCDDFWGMWREILSGIKFEGVVCNEPYGKTIADMFDAEFFIYDPSRELNKTKATLIRKDPIAGYGLMSHYMQKALRTTVTIFGAESNGKTTLTEGLSWALDAPFIHEYARPYLEFLGPEINEESMTGIFRGQASLQMAYQDKPNNSPWMIQDTDLFSTVGYWEQPHWEESLGRMPSQMVSIAESLKSDLYIIPRSNIPFEQDPLRYGGDKRESSDEYWIGVAEGYGLNYVVLDGETRAQRLDEACKAIVEFTSERLAPLKYERNGA